MNMTLVKESMHDLLLDKIHQTLISPEFGFTESDINDGYSWKHICNKNQVNISFDDNTGYINAEVRAELSYDGMEKLADALNSIIRAYDSSAYFDMVEPGIMCAYMDTEAIKKNAKTVNTQKSEEKDTDEFEMEL